MLQALLSGAGGGPAGGMMGVGGMGGMDIDPQQLQAFIQQAMDAQGGGNQTRPASKEAVDEMV